MQIVSYRASWPTEFARIAATLRNGLGDLALRIDHIGSTAVPGLASKDVIDVQITVERLGEGVLRMMEEIRYQRHARIDRDHRPPGSEGPDTEWEKWFFLAPENQRPTNTHVRVTGNANQRYALLFRDYLRAQPATAEAYARLKRALANGLADPSSYSDVKDPAVDLIYLPAQRWAEEIGWQPGASDG